MRVRGLNNNRYTHHNPSWFAARVLERFKRILAHPREHQKFSLGELKKAFKMGVQFGYHKAQAGIAIDFPHTDRGQKRADEEMDGFPSIPAKEKEHE